MLFYFKVILKTFEVGNYVSPITYCLLKPLAWDKPDLNSLEDSSFLGGRMRERLTS